MSVTWDSMHIGTNLVLSNGNLTITYNSTGASPSGFSTGGVSSGKYYWETVCTDGSGAGFTGGGSGIGMGGTGSNTAFLGSAGDQSAVGFYPANGSLDGHLYWNSVQQLLIGAPASYPATFCHALDAGGRLYWIRIGTTGNWNGNSSNNPATGTGGFSLPSQVVTPFVPGTRLSGQNDFVDAKFATESWAGTPPAGFISLDPPTGWFMQPDMMWLLRKPGMIAQD